MDVNFELYKIFYHAAKYKNFSDAAKKLFISQSAVSQAIKNLEEKMGSRLFYRKSRSVELTQEGQLLYTHVEQAYNFIKTAESKISQMQNMDCGEVRIGVSDTICKYYLISYLGKFTEMYPKIKIQVVNRTSSQIIGALKNGLIDFGIATLPVNEDGFDIIEFIEVEDIFVASYKYDKLMDRPISLSELIKYPLLTLPRNSTTRVNLDSLLKTMNLSITPEIVLESVDLLIEFAKLGLGVSHVLKVSALEAIEKQELFEVKVKEELPLRKLGIISMENVPLSNAADKFIRHLCAH
jgi:DNA-binding transcriptional LysR family regulator